MEQLPKRKPTRLPQFDYGQTGAYFLTLCTKENRCIFGYVAEAVSAAELPIVHLSPTGELVWKQIQTMTAFYPHVSVDHFVVMPNHVHLLLAVTRERAAETPANATVPQFVSTLKRFSNKQAGAELWQRSYHDHVVRNEQDYRRIWQYIDSNAAKWKEDRYYQAER